jgi:hypothetical protein
MIAGKMIRIAGVVALVAVPVALALLQSAGAQEQPQLPQPSAEHRLLHKDVGTWDAEITVFSPVEGAPPMKSKGTETCEVLPGGMWLVSRFKGEMIGMPFSGIGTTGYDPVEKKYVGTWVDSMSPHLMIMKGEYDPATKNLTSTGEGRDATTGQMFTSKQISRHIDDTTRTFEMHMPGPDGEQFKVMEITYKRRAK